MKSQTNWYLMNYDEFKTDVSNGATDVQILEKLMLSATSKGLQKLTPEEKERSTDFLNGLLESNFDTLMSTYKRYYKELSKTEDESILEKHKINSKLKRLFSRERIKSSPNLGKLSKEFEICEENLCIQDNDFINRPPDIIFTNEKSRMCKENFEDIDSRETSPSNRVSYLEEAHGLS